MLELVLILITINTWIVIKKMFLNIMIMFIIHNTKWRKSNKLTLKIEPIIITMTVSISKMLMLSSYKNIGIYNIGYITKKTLMMVKKLTVSIHCIYLLITREDKLKKKVWLNIWFLTLQIKNKMMFWIELRIKSKK